MPRGSVELIAALLLATSALGAERLDEVARIVWQGEVVRGISGAEVSRDGSRLLTVNDVGWLIEAELIRDDAGRLSGAVTRRVDAIPGSDGFPVAARRVRDWADAEGLAEADDGTLWIAFERWSRVARWDRPASQAVWIKDHPDFIKQRANRALESVALDPEGRVIALPERPLKAGFPIYRLEPDGWRIAGHLPAADGFSVTGADYDDRGRLWILERKLVLGLWWRNRVRVLDDIDDPAAVRTVWTGARNAFFNLEGLSAWTAADGVRLVLVGDNNGGRDDPTDVVEFRVIED